MQNLRTQNFFAILVLSLSLDPDPSVLVNDSVKAVSDEERAKLFSKHFYSIFTDSTMLSPT